MRVQALLVFLCCSVFTYGQKKNPFSALDYDSVVLYDFEGGKGAGLYIVEQGKLAPSIKRQTPLTHLEAQDITRRLGAWSSYGGGTAACFDPHLGIVYYKQGHIVRYVTVCMDCNRLAADVDIPAQQQGKVGKGHGAYYLGEGLSAAFKKHLNGLLKKYRFSHQMEL